MENSNEKKIVQNAILIDTSDPADNKEPKISSQESFPPAVNPGNTTPNSTSDNVKKGETELQNKNDKRKNFFSNLGEKLKMPQSEVLKKKILSFINDANNDKFKGNELKQKVSDFINDFEIEFQNLWKENCENESDNGEAIEGIVTKALYKKLILLYPSERDRKVEKLFKIYDFLQLSHLECKQDVINPNCLEQSFKRFLSRLLLINILNLKNLDLSKIDDYKTPRDKLISIVNCCKVVSSMVSHSNKDTSKPTGADDFLPVLIYVVLRAQPKNPIANIEFIRDYRQPHRLRGEEDYYFTAYDSAVSFIEKLDPSQLKIDPKEFHRLCDLNNKKYFEEIQEETKNGIDPNESTFKPFKDLNNVQENNQKVIETEMTEFQNQHLSNIKSRINEVKDLFSIMESKKLKYTNKEYNQLTVAEVSDMLNEYKYVMNLVTEMKKKVGDLDTYCDDLENSNGNQNKKTRRLFGIF